MRELNLTLSSDNGPVYLKLSHAIRSQIQKGILKPGETLPSTRRMAEHFGLNRHTIMGAIEELVAEGWVTAVERKGYQVSQFLPSSFFVSTKKKTILTKKQSISLPLTKIPVDYPFWNNKEYKYRFQSGLADLRMFPIEEFRTCLNDSVKRMGDKILNYAAPEGLPSLIQEVDAYLRRMRSIHDRSIVITNGSQEALFITAQLLLKEGSAVGVEQWGYVPAWEALKIAGGNLVPIPMDENGILPDAFEASIKKHGLKLLYLTPLHQYPTTLTMPITRRKEIYALAVKHNVVILEDDYDHEYHFRSEPLAPMASDDPAGIIIYISTFSKVLFPSARIGYLAVPESLHGPFLRFKRVLSRQNDSLLQDAVARWMRDGAFERHLRKMRRTYASRRDCIVETIQEMEKEGYAVSVNVPDGGMAVWMNTHQDSEKVAMKASKKGVYVVPETAYTLKKEKGTHLRLGFANQNEKEISAGMQILKSCL